MSDEAKHDNGYCIYTKCNRLFWNHDPEDIVYKGTGLCMSTGIGCMQTKSLKEYQAYKLLKSK